jgi:hypothetical protein
MYINLLNQEEEIETLKSKLKRKFHEPEATDTYNNRDNLLRTKEKVIKVSEEEINNKLLELHHLANLLRNMYEEFQYKFNSGDDLISPEKNYEQNDKHV